MVPMSPLRKRAAPHADAAEQEIREQEVLRANRELAAYFRGRRTEREARAALKIIKAFIRHRERMEPSSRRPLPGAKTGAATDRKRKMPAAVKKVRRPAGGPGPSKTSKPEDARVGSAEPLPAVEK
jgi:hypothetical protein